MTPLLTVPQEMFFVILTFVLFAALVGDFRNARFFRSIKNRPSPWKDLAKEVKVFICILLACMIWAQNKMLMPGGGESLSNVTLESVEGTGDWLSGSSLETTGGGSYSMTREGSGEAAGITWALCTALPPFTTNAVLTESQYLGGFACVSVTNIQPSALNAPSNAVVYTNWPYAVARHSVPLPQGCLPAGFEFGGRAVTNLYVSASGMLSFDSPKSSPTPATNGIPDGTAVNYISVLQTPSDIVPTNGLFWYAPGTNSSLFTWKDVFLGQDTNCLATVQAQLYASGDFTCRYYFPSLTNHYAQLTNAFLIGAQNRSGGETVLYTNNLLSIHPSFLPAFELQWKSLAGLGPNVSDYDNDGLSDADELFIYRSDPRNSDSDGDALMDGEEVSSYGTDPNAFSSDASGQGDLWRILGGLDPSDAPYTFATPSESVGILTITTRLENAPSDGGAVLRIGNQYIPVLSGTTLVSRIALPRDATYFFILARGVNCDNSIAHITVEASSFTKIRDPSGALSGSFTLSPASVNASGTLIMPSYVIKPEFVCFHSPTSSVLRIESSDPDIYFNVGQGRVREYTPTKPENLPAGFTIGAITGSLACASSFFTVTGEQFSHPAHFCNGTSWEEDPDDEEDWYCHTDIYGHTVGVPGYTESDCPCIALYDNAYDCFCSGRGEYPCPCAHPVCDPYATPADETHDGPPYKDTRGHAILEIGKDTSLFSVTVPQGEYEPCPRCWCAMGQALSAYVFRQTGNINVTPLSLYTNGSFAVTGIQPSTNFAAEVLTVHLKDTYIQQSYTVLGTSVYPTDTGHSVSNWFVGCNVTNALMLWTGVKLPSDTGEVTLSVTVESGTPAPQLYVYNRVMESDDLLVSPENLTFTQNLGDWRDTYCDTNGYVQAYLLCASGGVGRVTHSYETYSGQSYSLSCHGEQKFTALHVDIDGDYNRDGTPVDDVGEADPVTFDGPKGMVILANTDDDVVDQTKQPDCSDNVINGSADLPDVYTLKIQRLGITAEAIPDGLTFTLNVENPADEVAGTPLANARVRIFRSTASNADGVIGPAPQADTVVFKKEPGSGELDIALLAGTGYLEMGIEGIEFGRQVIVRLSSSLDDNDIGSDSIRLLVSPFLLLSNLAPATKVYIGADSTEYGWSNFFANVSVALNGVVPLESYCPESYIQDKAEIGYTCSAPGQTSRKQNIVMGLEGDWFREMMDADTGYFQNPIGISGGNLEVTPPFEGFPYGRVIVGANKFSLENTRSFFKSQSLQTDNESLIELPVGWLAVGHVDEVFTIIPAGSGFKVLVADLELAINLLRTNITNETFGGFTTRSEILAEYDANSNRVAEICVYLANIRSVLSQSLGVNENTFIKVPVTFTIATDENIRTALPNMINMIVVKNVSGVRRLLIPEPFFDPFWDDLATKIGEQNYENDEFNSVFTTGPHSGGGEAHCASNVQRIAP